MTPFTRQAMATMNQLKFKFRGLLYECVEAPPACGLLRVTDPERPGSVATTEHVFDVLRRCATADEVDAVVHALSRVRGVGRKRIDAWLSAAGWRRGFVRAE